MAHNHKDCYKCPYCVLSCRSDLIEANLEHPFEYDNSNPPAIKSLPVSVNNYFGDPFVQEADTLRKLEILEKNEHSGPVCIITKSYLTSRLVDKLKQFNVSLQVLYSISGIKDNFDGIRYGKKVESLEQLIQSGIKASLYFRPIISGINDSEESIARVLEDYKKIGGKAFSYSGLMGKKSVLKLLEMNGYNPIVPDGHEEWLEDKKLMSEQKKKFLLDTANAIGLLPFMKTSCITAYNAGMGHDYNGHFYKPSAYNCPSCVKYNDCKSFKDGLTIEKVRDSLERQGINFLEAKKEESGICPLVERCSHPTQECYTMQAVTVCMDAITMGDESILKWVTGAKVKANKIIPDCEVTILDHLL